MTARNGILAALGAACAAVVLLFLVTPGDALAQCCAPPSPPPTPCCAPPVPPPRPPVPPTPPGPPCCNGPTPGHNVYVPGVNVFVAPTVVVNAKVNAVANASASAGAGALGGATAIYYGGGGGGGGIMPPQSTGVIQGLNVQGGRRERRGYEATRTKTMRVVIRAVCIDDREVPHPASQVFADRDVEQGYEGELYRCLAGSRLQWTTTEFNGQVACFTTGRGGRFDGIDEACLIGAGQTATCAKGEALYHGADGVLACRPQRPARDCNERSLLRRFGAGIKVLTMVSTERYTEYREEEVIETSASSMSLTLDGGVGGTAY